MQKEFPDHYDFFPKTFLLPYELSDFKNAFKTPEELEADRERAAAREAEKRRGAAFNSRSPITVGKGDDKGQLSEAAGNNLKQKKKQTTSKKEP